MAVADRFRYLRVGQADSQVPLGAAQQPPGSPDYAAALD